MPYIIVFIAAFMLALGITPLTIRLGYRLQLIDRPGGRRRHQEAIPRLGGIALFTGFFGAGWLVFFLSSQRVWPPIGPEDHKLLLGTLSGSLFAFLCGLWDDWQDLRAWTQLLVQLTAALIAIGFDIIIQQVNLPLLGELSFPWWLTYPLTIFWVVGMINTVNLLDGLDGLAAGVAAIASLLFAIHAYSLGQTMVAFFPLALAAACLGFLYFNFHPARIFMGSNGSMFLGFALAALSILAPAKVATALLVLGIPILDVFWLIIWRWRRRGNPMQAGRDHLHYRLLDLGLTQRQIVMLYYLFCATFGLLALLIEVRLFKLIALGMMSLMTLTLLWLLARQDNPPTSKKSLKDSQ